MFNCTGSLKLNQLFSNLALHFKCIKGNVDFVKEKKVCHITILAGLSFVAPGAEACIVADADPCVFARRVALRFGVENEPDRDPSGRVRARGANAEKSHQGGQQHRRTETHKTHGWFLFCLSSGEREEQTDGRRRWRRTSTETSPRVAPAAAAAARMEATTEAVPGECLGVGGWLVWRFRVCGKF